MKWIFSSLCLLLMTVSPLGLAANALLQVSASHEQGTTRAFDGVDGQEVKRFETKLAMPLLALASHTGDWFAAGEFSENRFLLSGASTSRHRLYRLSLPMELEANPTGRWQHFWRFAPSYYTDESLIDQNRYVNEFAWQVKYQANRKVKWVVGVRQDTRFALTEMYPVFGLESQPNARVYHHWVFPDVYSEIRFKRGQVFSVFMQPNGGNWRYRQDDGTKSSFGMMDWKAGVAWAKPLNAPLQLKASLGLSMNGKGSIAGTDGDLADGYFFLLAIETPLLN